MACALATVIAWSGFILMSRLASVAAVSPYDLTAMRFGVAALLLLPFARRLGLFSLPPLRGIAFAATAGIGFTLLAFAGLGWAPAGHGSVLMPGTLPLWTAILAWIFLAEHPTRFRLGMLASILAGIGVILWASLSGQAIPGAWRGDILFLLAALAWGIFTILARRWNVDPMLATAAIAIYSALLYLPVYLLFLPKGLWDTPLDVLLLHGAFQATIPAILTMFLFTRAVAAIGAGTTTMITAAVPGAVAISAWPLLGEVLQPDVALGAALVTAGMLGTVLDTARSPRRPSAGRGG